MSTLKVNAVETYSGTALSLGTAADTVTVPGSTVIGTNNAETVTVNAKVNSAVIPDGDGTRDLGSAAAQWNIYSATATFTTITGPAASDLTITSAQDIYMNPTGSVGIGTAAPAATLHVSKADARVRIEATTADNNCQLDFYNGNGKYVNIGNSINTAGSLFEINEVSPSAGNVMTILTGGNIGVGTTAPSSAASIAKFIEISDASSAGVVLHDTGGTEVGIYSADSGLHVTMNSSQVIRVNENGRVGIGTGSPNQLLHVAGAAEIDGNLTIDGNLIVNGTTTTIESTTLTVDDKNIELGTVDTPSDTTADGGGITLKGATDKTITWVNATDKWTFNQGVHVDVGDLVVDASVGIGTAAPGTALQIEGATPYMTLKNSTAENTDGGCESRIIFEDHADVSLAQIEGSHAGSADDTKGALIFSTHNNSALTEAMRINESQYVGIGTTDPGTQVQIQSTAPYLTLKNSTSEHTEGGCESRIIFEDHANIALAQIQASHAGASDNGAGDLIFSTSTVADPPVLTEAIRIDESQNVGIGTATPASKLDVEGGVSIGASYSGTTAAPTNGLIVEGIVGIGTNAPTSNLEIESSSGDQVFEMDNNVANSANFQIQNGAGNNRVDLVMNALSANTTLTMKAQKVGIMDTSPSYTLDVNGDAQITTNLTLGGILSLADGSAGAPSLTNTGDTNCGLYFSAADTLAFTAGGTAQVTFADGVIAPVTTDDVDLGTASLRFKNIYTMDLHLANDRGDWTVIEEENYLSLRNNKNGKMFKIVMEEI